MSHVESVFVHPTAFVETDDIGAGTRIWAFVHISKNVHLGMDCNICDGVAVQSDVYIGSRVTIKEHVVLGTGTHIGDDVFIAPLVVTPNDRVPRSPRMAGVPEIAERYSRQENWLAPSRICRGASIGTGVVIMPGVTIGSFAMVGAGALVTKDVAPHQLIVGSPARAIGWVCLCGVKLRQTENGFWKCECGRQFSLTDRDGLRLQE